MEGKKLVWRKIDSLTGDSHLNFNDVFNLLNDYKQRYNVKDLRIRIQEQYGCIVDLTIDHQRLETETEFSERIKSQKENIEIQKQNDLRVLKKLKDKYER